MHLLVPAYTCEIILYAYGGVLMKLVITVGNGIVLGLFLEKQTKKELQVHVDLNSVLFTFHLMHVFRAGWRKFYPLRNTDDAETKAYSKGRVSILLHMVVNVY